MKQNSPQDAAHLKGYVRKRKKCLPITVKATLKKSGEKTEIWLGWYTLLRFF